MEEPSSKTTETVWSLNSISSTLRVHFFPILQGKEKMWKQPLKQPKQDLLYPYQFCLLSLGRNYLIIFYSLLTHFSCIIFVFIFHSKLYESYNNSGIAGTESKKDSTLIPFTKHPIKTSNKFLSDFE